MNEKDERDEKCTEKKMFTDSFGIIDLTNREAKEEYYGEIAHMEEARVRNAQRRYHARMTQEEREKATMWIGYYRYMVGDGQKE